MTKIALYALILKIIAVFANLALGSLNRINASSVMKMRLTCLVIA
jgi:hypothetical protein